jgi:hypothetical protein
MMDRLLKIAGLTVAFAGLSGTAPAPGDPAASLSALNAIQPGQWALRARNGTGTVRTLCLGDTRQLLQIRHSGAACTRFIIGNDASQAVVAYSCPGMGNGRTTVRVETPRLIQIDSQGIANNEPFDLTLEGRRVGECPANATTAQRMR